MNYNSKIDKYFTGDSGDLNGNFKMRNGGYQDQGLGKTRKLSQSDPMLLSGLGHGQRSHVHSNTCHSLWEYQVGNVSKLEYNK